MNEVAVFFFSRDLLRWVKALLRVHTSQVRRSMPSLHASMIVFIAPSGAEDNPSEDWAATLETIPRRCPICLQDTIVSHGRRRKQAHDEKHDWIEIRRGVCHPCCTTFTFLPWLSPPYGHYSLIARSQALQRYFSERCSLEAAAPLVKDPDRVAAASTVGRWFHAAEILQCCKPSPQESSAAPSTNGISASGKARSFPLLSKIVDVARRTFIDSPHGPFLNVLLPQRC